MVPVDLVAAIIVNPLKIETTDSMVAEAWWWTVSQTTTTIIMAIHILTLVLETMLQAAGTVKYAASSVAGL